MSAAAVTTTTAAWATRRKGAQRGDSPSSHRSRGGSTYLYVVQEGGDLDDLQVARCRDAALAREAQRKTAHAVHVLKVYAGAKAKGCGCQSHPV